MIDSTKGNEGEKMNQTINLGIEGLDLTFSIEEVTTYNYETKQWVDGDISYFDPEEA